MATYTSLSTRMHDLFVEATHYVRDQIGRANVSSFSLSISASGRTQSERDEVLIEYEISAPEYGRVTVKGNALHRVLEETLRRHGWDETHAPLALPKPSAAPKKPKPLTKTALAEYVPDETN